MKAIELGTSFDISLLPRVVPSNDDSISIEFVNEVSGVSFTKSTTWVYEKQRLVLSFSTHTDFKASNKYKITVKNGTDTIYLGNLIVLKNGTNTQNYTPSEQRTQRYKKKA